MKSFKAFIMMGILAGLIGLTACGKSDMNNSKSNSMKQGGMHGNNNNMGKDEKMKDQKGMSNKQDMKAKNDMSNKDNMDKDK